MPGIVIGGFLGAALGTVVYEFIVAIAFPMVGTSRFVSVTPGTRLLARIAVTVLAAAGVAMGLTMRLAPERDAAPGRLANSRPLIATSGAGRNRVPIRGRNSGALRFPARRSRAAKKDVPAIGRHRGVLDQLVEARRLQASRTFRPAALKGIHAAMPFVSMPTKTHARCGGEYNG